MLGITSYTVESNAPIPTGKTQVRMEFAYDDGGNRKGGAVTLFFHGKEVGNGRVGDNAKDADHYIPPDERLRVAMARQ